MYRQTEEWRYRSASGPDGELGSLGESFCQGREGEGKRANKGDLSIEREACECELLPLFKPKTFLMYGVCRSKQPDQTLTCKMSRLATKPTKWQVRPTKTQISLGICPV